MINNPLVNNISNLFLQTTSSPEMADALRENGKIYVVVICALIVMGAILILVLRTDIKISSLESRIKLESKENQKSN